MKPYILLTLILSLFVSACGSSKPRSANNKVTPAAVAAPEIQRMQPDQVTKITSDWPVKSRQVMDRLIVKYGQPSEATNSMVIWNNNNPWKKTVLYKDQGKNTLEQTADMAVPPEKLGDLSMFNKSITVNQANNEVSARSNKEETNFLAMNLAKEIADGRMSAMEARKQYSSVTDVMGRSQYMENLNFGPTQGQGTPAPTDNGSL